MQVWEDTDSFDILDRIASEEPAGDDEAGPSDVATEEGSLLDQLERGLITEREYIEKVFDVKVCRMVARSTSPSVLGPRARVEGPFSEQSWAVITALEVLWKCLEMQSEIGRWTARLGLHGE